MRKYIPFNVAEGQGHRTGLRAQVELDAIEQSQFKEEQEMYDLCGCLMSGHYSRTERGKIKVKRVSI